MKRDDDVDTEETKHMYQFPLTREVVAAASAALFSIVAHLFCWTNTLYSHDSTLVNQIDVGWQISLGRYFNPVYVQLRGSVASPLFVGALTTVFIAIAAILIVRLLDLKRVPAIIVTGIALSTNATVSALNATFLIVSDIYALSALLSVAAIYLPTRWRGLSGYALGSICIFVSLGLYQSYIQVAVALALISLAKDVLDAKSAKAVFKRGLAIAAMIIAGGVLYAVGIVAAQYITGTSIVHSYHGLDSVGNYEGVALAPLLAKTYYLPLKRLFLAPETLHPQCIALVNIALALASLFALLKLARQARIDKRQAALLVFLTLMLPLGVNCVCFVSKGLVGTLTTYSYSFFYIWSMMLLDKFLGTPSANAQNACSKEPSEDPAARKANHMGAIVLCAGAIILFCNVGFANKLYLTKALEEQATISYLTRVEDRMEQVDGYVPGETPVVFAGSFYAIDLVSDHEGIKPEGLVGFEGDLAITYYETYTSYFWTILGCPINVADRQTMIERIQTPQVQEMPIFPAAGSCSMVDGVMVVRISDDLQQEINMYNYLRE